MIHTWQDGVWLPRWAENLGFGLGIPLFVYAPPLPYFLTGLLHLAGLDLETAFKGTWLLGLWTGTAGAYHLGRSRLGWRAGVVAATAFAYAPIQLRELFIQGNQAQYLAWAFAPWAAWSLIRIFETGRRRYALTLALALTGTLLSHNAAALLAMGMVAVLGLTLSGVTRSLRGLWLSVGGSVLGLLLSAWFWVPALLEGQYVHLDKIVASDFRQRFIPLAELVALSPPLDTGAINPYFPLTLGAVQVWMAALGAGVLLAWGVGRLLRPGSSWTAIRLAKLDGGSGLFFVAFSLFCGFMALAWSEPLWRLLPFMELFEWPFRWHGFTALGLSWLCGLALVGWSRLLRLPAAAIEGATMLCVLLLMGSALVNLYPHKLAPNRQEVTPADVVRFEVRTGAVGTTSLGEFNPIWIEGALQDSPLVQDYLAGRPVDRLAGALPDGAEGEQLLNRAQEHRFRLRLPQPATVTLQLLYFPGWVAWVDGEPVAVRPQPGTGLLTVEVPAGEHELWLRFIDTPLRWMADLASAAAWLLLAFWVGLALMQRRPLSWPRRRLQIQGPTWGQVASLLGCVLLILGVRAAFPDRFRLESPPDQALPASRPLRADFEDQIRLLGVDPAPETAWPGEAISLVAYWRALQPLETDYAVYLHLDAPDGQTVATTDLRHPGDIPTSDWATGLYVRSPFRLAIPAEAWPIRYDLHLGVYDPVQGRNLAASPGSQWGASVGQLWVMPAHGSEPSAGLWARFGEAIQLVDVKYDLELSALVLYWRREGPVPDGLSIFVHLLDDQGVVLGQADGVPYQNLYPPDAWWPGQVVEDVRALPHVDVARTAAIALGVYELGSGRRWPAVDSQGQPLADDALVVRIHP